jgi:4-hydroxyphenylpyruvate dioxygenase-like putative hemolysin
MSRRGMLLVYWWESQKERDHWEDQWVDNNKMDLRETGWDGVDWIDRAQDRDQWRTLVNTVLNLRVP